jgi:FMN phosphatase YigB (HAD superfamily)
MGLRVGVDLDDVLYPFVQSLACFVHERTGRPLEELGPATCWEFYERYWGLPKNEFLELFEAGVDAGVVFSKGDPLPGSVEAVRALKEVGHSVHIVTDRFVGRRSHANTEEWLAKHEIPYDSLTYSRDKTVVRTDAFVDDNPKNVLALREVGCAAFLLDTGRADQVGFRQEWTVDSLAGFVGKVEEMAIGPAKTGTLVGVRGYAQSGKDSVAAVLVSRYGFTRAAFADALKELACRTNPIVSLDGRRLASLVDEIGWDRAKTEVLEVREILQRLGKGARDVLGEDIWVDTLFRRHAGASRLVIPDVRFPNEAAAVRGRGGRVVRVVRPGVGPANGHISETALDDDEPDAVIMNDGFLDDLAEEVEDVLGEAISR